MEAVVGLMLVLLGVSHGVETHCDGRQDGVQCYGALGGTVVIQLMDNASNIPRYQWNKNKQTVFTRKNSNFSQLVIQDRSFFTPSNGTFRINNLSRTDGDNYTLQTYDSNGKVLEQRSLLLFIQAPVSSVQLVSECLSLGEMRASCSSEGGDSPQYSWTLDGHTLTDSELLSGNTETNIITLKQHVSGNLLCSVWNHVSRVSNSTTLSTCVFINCTLHNGTHISQWMSGTTDTLCIRPTTVPTMISDTTVGKETDIIESSSVSITTNMSICNQTVTPVPWYIIMGGVLSALVILLVIGVAVICAQKMKNSSKPKEEEDEHELTYADVRIMQRQARQTQPRPETELEVEYGQVRFSERPRKNVEPAGEDCMYAMVRKDR